MRAEAADPVFGTTPKVSSLNAQASFAELEAFRSLLTQLSVNSVRFDTSFTNTRFPEIAGGVQVSVVDTS
jgi:hypothetical protein